MKDSKKQSIVTIGLALVGLSAILYFIFKPKASEAEHAHGIPEYQLSLKYPRALFQLLDHMNRLERGRTRSTRTDLEITAAAKFVLANARENSEDFTMGDLFRVNENESSKNFNWLVMEADEELKRYLNVFHASGDFRSKGFEAITEQIQLCLDRRQRDRYAHYFDADDTILMFRRTGVRPPLKNDGVHCLHCINLWIDDLGRDRHKARVIPACALFRVINEKRIGHLKISGMEQSFRVEFLPSRNSLQRYGEDARIDVSVWADVPLENVKNRLDTGINILGLKPSLAGNREELLREFARDKSYLPTFTAREEEAEYYIRNGQFLKFLHALGIPAASRIISARANRVEGGFKVPFTLSHNLLPQVSLVQYELLVTSQGIGKLHTEAAKVTNLFLAETRKQVLPNLKQIDGFNIYDVKPLPEYSKEGNILGATMEIGPDISSPIHLSLDVVRYGGVRLAGTISAAAQQQILTKLIRREGIEQLSGWSRILNCRVKAEGVLGGDLQVSHPNGKLTIPWEFTSGSYGLKFSGNEQRTALRNMARQTGKPVALDETDIRTKVQAKLGELLGPMSADVTINEIRATKDRAVVAWSVRVADWPELSLNSILPANLNAQALDAFAQDALREIQAASEMSWSKAFVHPRFGRVTASIGHIASGNKSSLDFRIDVKPTGEFKDILKWVDRCRRVEDEGWRVLDEAGMQAELARELQPLLRQFAKAINTATDAEIVEDVNLDLHAFEGKWLRLNPLTLAFKARVKIPRSNIGVTLPFIWSIENGIQWQATRAVAKQALANVMGAAINGADLEVDMKNKTFRLGGIVPLDGGGGLATFEGHFSGSLKDNSYEVKAGLNILGEGRVGHFRGRLTGTPRFTIDADAETVGNDYVDWIGMKGSVNYQHAREMAGEVDFNLGLMTRAGGGIKLEYENEINRIERLRLKGTASFPILSFLPAGIQLLGDAQRPLEGQQFGLKDLELVGKASVNLFLTTGTVTAWADHNNGIKKIRFSWDDPSGKRLNFDLDSATAESMTAEELQQKIKKILVDHLEKELVDKAMAESPEGQALKNLIKEHFREKDGKYRLNKDANPEAIDRIAQAFSKENKQRERKGKKPAFLASPPEMSEEDKELASRLPENKAYSVPEEQWEHNVPEGANSAKATNNNTGDMPDPISDIEFVPVGCSACENGLGKCDRSISGICKIRDVNSKKEWFHFSSREAELGSSHDWASCLVYSPHKEKGHVAVFFDYKKKEFRILEKKDDEVSVEDLTVHLRSHQVKLLEAFHSAWKQWENRSFDDKASESVMSTYLETIQEYLGRREYGLESQVGIYGDSKPMTALKIQDKKQNLFLLQYAHEAGMLGFFAFMKQPNGKFPGQEIHRFLKETDYLRPKEYLSDMGYIHYFNPVDAAALILYRKKASKTDSPANHTPSPLFTLQPYLKGKRVGDSSLTIRDESWFGSLGDTSDGYAYLFKALTQFRSHLSSMGQIYLTDAGFCFLLKPDDQGDEGRIVFWAAAEQDIGVVSVSYRKFVEGLDARPDLIQRLPKKLRETGQRRLELKDPKAAERLARELVTKRMWKGKQGEEGSGWKSNPLGVLLNLMEE
jgi:hypothetical protein